MYAWVLAACRLLTAKDERPLITLLLLPQIHSAHKIYVPYLLPQKNKKPCLLHLEKVTFILTKAVNYTTYLPLTYFTHILTDWKLSTAIFTIHSFPSEILKQVLLVFFLLILVRLSF